MAYDEVVLYVIDLLVLEWPVSSLCLCCFSIIFLFYPDSQRLKMPIQRDAQLV